MMISYKDFKLKEKSWASVLLLNSLSCHQRWNEFQSTWPWIKTLCTLAQWDKIQSSPLDINLVRLGLLTRISTSGENYVLKSKFPGKLLSGKQPLEHYLTVNSAFLLWNLPAVDTLWIRKLTITAEKRQTKIEVFRRNWASHATPSSM